MTCSITKCGIDNVDKLIRISSDGKIHADISGTAGRLGNVPIAFENLEGRQILTYHESTNTFRNEAKTAVGVGKSLILYDGTKVLGDYNGGATVRINLQDVLNCSSLSQEVSHLMRLTENLYIALESADLNPSGYDGLSGETFYGSANDIDTTAVNVESLIQGDDSIDVDSIDELVEGAHYILTNGAKSLDVQIKHIKSESATTKPRRFSLNTPTS